MRAPQPSMRLIRLFAEALLRDITTETVAS